MTPTILHISNDYLGSSVYRELYSKLEKLPVNQIVYFPARGKLNDSNDKLRNSSSYEVVHSSKMKKYHRVFFHAKINFLYKDIIKKVSFDHVSVVHATTWYSDGALAYRLYKAYNTPYIITVRNTDLNLFLKYMYHLRGLAIEILRCAQKIIFISPVYLTRFAAHPFVSKHFKEIESKTAVIPNGVNDYWVSNRETSITQLKSPVQLLYVGKFTKGKNVERLILAAEKLHDDGVSLILNIVGGGGNDKEKIERLIGGKDFIRYHGKVYDKNVLRNIMSQCDVFTMPSKRETFGLVYIEALTQGLPIVYTKNEGIDGFYDDSIGVAVDPYDISNIKDGIMQIIRNFEKYKFDIQKIAQNHNWENIAENYLEIYKQVGR